MPHSNDEQLQHDLAIALPPATRQVLVRALDVAYRDAGQCFNLEAGCDAQWFGFTIFKFVAHQIAKALTEDPSLDIEVIGSGTGAFRLRVGAFVIAPYRCGPLRPQDPWQEFPSNHNGAGLLVDLNSGQIEMFAGFDDDQIGLVLGHYGNWDTGLAAVYLKKPISKTNGQISEWAYVEEVFRLGGDALPAPAEAPRTPVLPPPATVVRPKVLPFKRKPLEGAEGEGA